MAAGDIWQIILEATYAAKQMRNVFYYIQNSSNVADTVAAQNVAKGFEENFFLTETSEGLVGGTFATAMQWTGVEVINLFNDQVFYNEVFDPAYAGTGTANAGPSYVALGFTSSRGRRDIRRGKKRFGGLVESVYNFNDVEAAALLSADVIATQLGREIADPNNLTQTFTPVVVQRIKEVDPVTGVVSYRLPASAAEAEYFLATTWFVDSVVTSQVSRK